MLYLILSTAFLLGGMFVVFWLHNQYQLDIVVEPVPPPVEAPLISVCIPARNEERNIRACVEAVLAQDYPNFEIIVLDDRSTDRTPLILRDLVRDSGSSLPERQGHTLTGTQTPESDLTAPTSPQAGPENPMPCTRLQPRRAASGCASSTRILFSPPLRYPPVMRRRLKQKPTCSPS